jgi:hypothetical protein
MSTSSSSSLVERTAAVDSPVCRRGGERERVRGRGYTRKRKRDRATETAGRVVWKRTSEDVTEICRAPDAVHWPVGRSQLPPAFPRKSQWSTAIAGGIAEMLAAAPLAAPDRRATACATWSRPWESTRPPPPPPPPPPSSLSPSPPSPSTSSMRASGTKSVWGGRTRIAGPPQRTTRERVKTRAPERTVTPAPPQSWIVQPAKDAVDPPPIKMPEPVPDAMRDLGVVVVTGRV